MRRREGSIHAGGCVGRQKGLSLWRQPFFNLTGEIFIRVENVSRGTFIRFAKKQGVKLFAAALTSTACLHFSTDYRDPVALVLGQEGSGVSTEILEAAEPLYIPMVGQAESLNVSAAAAVLLYEALRQRRYGRADA